MSSFREMVLLPRAEYDKWMQQHQPAAPSPIKEELQLRQLQDDRVVRQVRNSATPAATPVQSQQIEDPEWQRVLFLSVNERWHHRLRCLLRIIRSSATIRVEADSFEVFVNDKPLYNSNIVDLLHFAVRDSHPRSRSMPNSLSDFVQWLRENRVPHSALGLNAIKMLTASKAAESKKASPLQSPAKVKNIESIVHKETGKLGFGSSWISWLPTK
jgi:hypothetical protein